MNKYKDLEKKVKKSPQVIPLEYSNCVFHFSYNEEDGYFTMNYLLEVPEIKDYISLEECSSQDFEIILKNVLRIIKTTIKQKVEDNTFA